MVIALSLFSVATGTVYAASCSLPNGPDYGPNIGFQYVAQACPVSGKFIYNRYDLNCNQSSSVDGINQSIGSVPKTPEEMQAALIKYYDEAFPDKLPDGSTNPDASFKKSLKMFKNSTGSSFIFVVGSYSKYYQSIDGKNMGSSEYLYWPTFNSVDFGIFTYPGGQTPPCCLAINSPSAPASFKPSMGETASFSANITANYPISWTFALNGANHTGSGSLSYTWDGKNSGFPVSAGVYNGTLSATSASCNAGAVIPVTVVEPPKTCKMDVSFGSSANVATGNLSFSQDVFNTKGGVFPLGFSLTYNSLDVTQGSLGANWRHNYDISLKNSDSNGKVLVEGSTRHVYTWDGSKYVAETGDTSSLEKNGSAHDLKFTDGRTYHFLADNTLDNITDKDGNVMTFGYTGTDLVSVSVGGRSIVFGYDPVVAHRLISVADPNGNSFVFEYQNNLLWKVKNPVTDEGKPAGFWQYAYFDGTSLLKSKKDPAGNTIQYDYYSDKRVKSALDPSQKTRSMLYPTTTGNVRITTFTEKDTGQWQYTYDIQTGFLKEKSPVGGKKTSYYYNAGATLRAKTEPFDNNYLTTFYTYDSNGNMLTQTDPVDISGSGIDPQTVDIASLETRTPPIKTALRYTYDADHYYQIASITDERFTPFRTTSYLYTTQNSLKTTIITDPEGKQTISRYYANGTIAEVEDGNQIKTTYTYYPDTPENRVSGLAGQLATVTGPDSVSTRYTDYDLNGNPLEIVVRDAAQGDVVTTQEFDALNRLRVVTRVRDPETYPDNVIRYGYDNNGNLNSVIDPESKETTYLSNYQGQVTKVTDARLKDTVYEYGAAGCSSCSGVDKLTSITDARQKKTTYLYDTLGRLERETDPLNKVTRYTYYDSGLLKDKIDATIPSAEITLITHSYDTQGRLTKKHYADGTESIFTYYPDGALWTATNQNISYTYTYYKNGWLKSVTDTTNNRTITYDLYDNIGQRKTVTYFPTTPDQKTILYHYDRANRLDTVTSPAGLFSIGYDNLSRKKTLLYPNQITATFGYDDLNRLTSLTHKTAGGATIATYGYTHDQAGNRLTKTGTVNETYFYDGITKTGTVNETYFYDDIYRLDHAVTARGTEKFTYDDVGNRLTGPGPKNIDYQYNDGNQMVAGNTLSYLYDSRGNQKQRIINNAPDKSWILTWDDENRLKMIEKGKGTTEKRTTSFKYDPLGRRIEKTHVSLNKDGVSKTTRTTYVYDGDSIIMEITDDGTPINGTKTFYTHGQGTDEPLAMERGGQFYYYHTDGLGSITAITDASISGNIVQSYSYNSFGMPKYVPNIQNSYLFTGREWDKETQLYYYRARYYDPMGGRFISKDPIGFEGEDVNLYGYVSNNPINLLDPTGLSPSGASGNTNRSAGENHCETTVRNLCMKNIVYIKNLKTRASYCQKVVNKCKQGVDKACGCKDKNLESKIKASCPTGSVFKLYKDGLAVDDWVDCANRVIDQNCK